MARIKLTKGYEALIDDDDFCGLSKYEWQSLVNERRSRVVALRYEGGKRIYMHRFIMNAPPEMVVDHINRNPLDNRRANLRLCNVRQNHYNRSRNADKASSQFKGVYKEGDRWTARVTIDLLGRTRMIWLGSYPTEIEAAKAYDQAARELKGEFAGTNEHLYRRDVLGER